MDSVSFIKLFQCDSYGIKTKISFKKFGVTIIRNCTNSPLLLFCSLFLSFTLLSLLSSSLAAVNRYLTPCGTSFMENKTSLTFLGQPQIYGDLRVAKVEVIIDRLNSPPTNIVFIITKLSSSVCAGVTDSKHEIITRMTGLTKRMLCNIAFSSMPPWDKTS